MKRQKLKHERWEAEKARKRRERQAIGRGYESVVCKTLALKFRNSVMGKSTTKGEANRRAIAASMDGC